MRWTVTRRVALVGGLGALALAGAGVGLVASRDAAGAIARTLRRLLGEVRIADDALRQFTQDYLQVLRDRGIDPRIVEVFGLADTVLGNETLRRRLPAPLLERIERYERHLITHFTIGTTFFEVDDPHRDELDYVGLELPCRNPFARFA